MTTRTDHAPSGAATDNPACREQQLTVVPSDHPEYFKARGIGFDWDLTCLVTGEQRSVMPNVSGFVRSREAGERVVALFSGRAFLDFRASEPRWCQVKVGVIEEHKEVLERLCSASWACNGMIDSNVIAWALDPLGVPGGQPAGLKAATDHRVRIGELEAMLKGATDLLQGAGR